MHLGHAYCARCGASIPFTPPVHSGEPLLGQFGSSRGCRALDFRQRPCRPFPRRCPYTHTHFYMVDTYIHTVRHAFAAGTL
jgi:hypothetical protein